MLRRYFFIILATFLGFSSLHAEKSPTLPRPPEKKVLHNGWYLWDPYQYVEVSKTAGSTLTGLDIQLTKAIGKIAGKEVQYSPVEWKKNVEDLKTGAMDMASGATYTPERAQFVYFSKPYRYEEDALFIPRGQESDLKFKTLKQFLEQVKKKKYKLGVVDGYVYANPLVNEWLAKPENQDLIRRAKNTKKNLELLVQHKIQGFLADRIVGATEVWRLGVGNQVNEISLPHMKVPIHFMFSKASVPYSVVKKFNAAIKEIKQTNQYNRVIEQYFYPILLLQTIDTRWFQIIDIIGTIAFAISGLMVAFRDRATLFGAFLFALLPSMGGGIVRDIIFNRQPIGALQSPLYLFLVISTVIIGFIAFRFTQWLNRKYSLTSIGKQKNTAQTVLMICDALGLAAFTVSGVVVSVLAQAEPLWLWGGFFAFVTGAGGSLLRDTLSKDRNYVALHGGIYPEIAVIWGLFLSVFLTYESQNINPDPIRFAVMITVVGAFITRLLAYFYNIPNISFAVYGNAKSKEGPTSK